MRGMYTPHIFLFFMRNIMSNIEEKIRKDFDLWSDQGRAESMAHGHHSMTSQFLDTWEFTPEDSVIDIGCGNGWAVREMLKRGALTGTGVDLSPKMIDRAKNLSGDHERYFCM